MQIDNAPSELSEKMQQIENNEDEDLKEMKAKFNKLMYNFEREEIVKPTSADLGSQVGTAYFNSQENFACENTH